MHFFKPNLRSALICIALTAIIFIANTVMTQSTWPAHPVKIVVPFAPGGNTPAQFAAFITAEHVKWAKVVKASGAKAD